jgi:regulator of ribonuclease activity A
MNLKTAYLCDQFGDSVAVAEPIFRDFGRTKTFGGQIVTVKVFEDNALVRTLVQTAGHSRVLVIDGGGSLRCALLGERLAWRAHECGWAGIVVNGCIRDAADMAEIPIGIKAINTNPKTSRRDGGGEQNVPVHFAGITFVPGHYLHADPDGIIVSAQELRPGMQR